MKKEYVEPIPPMCDACFNVSDNDSWKKKWEEVRNAISDIPVKPIPLDNREEVDMVNKPPHYTSGRYECLDVMADISSSEEFIGFCWGSAFKYLWRWKRKGDPVENLEKCIFYINRLIETVKEMPIRDEMLP